MPVNYRQQARERSGSLVQQPVNPAVVQAVQAVLHMAGFRRTYPALAHWLEQHNTDFAKSLKRRIEGGYLLTPNQLAALERAAAGTTKKELP